MKYTLFTVVIINTLLFFQCKSDKNTNKQATSKYIITSPLVIDTAYNNDYICDIQSVKNIVIRARVSGYLEKIHVDEGSYVKKGQLLFTLNDEEFRELVLSENANVKSIQADVKVFELDVLSNQKLFDKNIISKTQLDISLAKLEAAKAKLDEANAKLATAKHKLSFTQIRAPFDGIIDVIPLKSGSLIEEGTLLTTLSDNTKMYVYFNISERDYLEYQEKIEEKNNDEIFSKVNLILANKEVHDFAGKVETVGGIIDKETGNIAFRASFPNPDLVLKHGSSGKIRLHKYLKNVMIIPQKSTYEVQNKIFVYVYDEKNHQVKSVSIVPKFRLPHIYVIEPNSLNLSDKIVYEGIQDLRDSTKIEANFTELKQLLVEFNQ